MKIIIIMKMMKTIIMKMMIMMMLIMMMMMIMKMNKMKMVIAIIIKILPNNACLLHFKINIKLKRKFFSLIF